MIHSTNECISKPVYLRFEWGGGRGDFSTPVFKLTNLARRMVERAQEDGGVERDSNRSEPSRVLNEPYLCRLCKMYK